MLRGISQLPAVATMSWVLLPVLWLIVQTQASNCVWPKVSIQ
ncbi:ADAMDEC1 isoform 3 [Pongo abelii]|uniref:ADAMDEC1 isoform 3 n=1 Tax=Pongo abelii TaxID=9601 RepID=A0A2J8X4V8_PONAB|nr:ADAMDEC1 isoform 3 [Pongo abelii]